MRALVCRDYGPPDNLVVENVDEPVAGKGEILVDIKAAGLNFPDVLVIGEQALRSIARGGRYLVIGFASGAIPNFPANLLLLREASAMGVWWGPWAMRNPKLQAQNLAAMGDMISKGRLHPRVTGSYALEDFSEAFRAITTRRVLGKVVFQMD